MNFNIIIAVFNDYFYVLMMKVGKPYIPLLRKKLKKE